MTRHLWNMNPERNQETEERMQTCRLTYRLKTGRETKSSQRAKPY